MLLSDSNDSLPCILSIASFAYTVVRDVYGGVENVEFTFPGRWYSVYKLIGALEQPEKRNLPLWLIL